MQDRKDESDQTLAELLEQVEQTGAEARRADAQIRELMEVASDVGHLNPDGNLAVQRARRLQRESNDRFAKAMDEFIEFFRNRSALRQKNNRNVVPFPSDQTKSR